jgi:hypothetical protein
LLPLVYVLLFFLFFYNRVHSERWLVFMTPKNVANVFFVTQKFRVAFRAYDTVSLQQICELLGHL